jgi:hypothetical protein
MPTTTTTTATKKTAVVKKTAAKKTPVKTTATRTGSPKARVTRKRQTEFTIVQLVAALENAWSAIRAKHPDVPAVVIVVGSGTSTRQAKNGHYAPTRWQHGDNRLAEVLVSGEGLKRPAPDVFTTLLHEAAHGLANARGIQDTSRQGRWHNQRFADLAKELGLDPQKDERIGWSPCTLRDETAKAYAGVLNALTKALQAYRHPEIAGEAKKKSNNGVACVCQCPRRIRVAKAVLEEGAITCQICDSDFEPEQ